MSDMQTITAKFVADITNFQANTRALVASANEVKTSAGDLSNALSTSGAGMERVSSSARPATDGLRQMSAAAHESHQGLMGMLDDFSQMSGNIQQVVQMIGSFIGALDKQYEAGQNAMRSFGNLSLSMEDAKKQYEDLVNTSAAKAFGVDKIVAARQYFDRLGKSVDVTNDEIAKMSDALAAAGQGGDNLIKVIDDMHKLQESSRVTTEQIDQLAKDGIQAWDLLSFGMHKSMDDTKKAVKDGTVTGKQAYQDLMNGVIKDTGAAEQKSHDLSASWSQLGQSATKALSPLIDGLTKLLDLLTKVHALEGVFAIATLGGSLIQNIPHPSGPGYPSGYASGIMDSPTSHWAMVGEQGPELMYVPEHASILPNGINPFANSGSSSSAAVPALPRLSLPAVSGGESGYSGPVTFQVYLDGRMLAEQTVPHMAPIIRAYSGRKQ